MMGEKQNISIIFTSYVKHVVKKLISIIIIVCIVVIRKLTLMKKGVLIMEDVKYVLKRILVSVGVHLAKSKDKMLGFLRHQITIWIIMKEKQNIRIIFTSCVNNVIKKFISRIS